MPRRRGRLLVTAIAAAVLALGTLGVPVAAANAKLAIVNGIPGRSVDVCVGATEVRSGLRYGQWFQRSQAPGNRTLRFRAASAGRCRGTILAQRTMTIASDADLTIVATKKGTRVISFDNDGLGTLGSPSAVDFGYIAVRHAGDMGAAVMRYQTNGLAYTPSVDPTFLKHDENIANSYSGPTDLILFATRAGSLVAFARVLKHVHGARRVEMILVGSNEANARFVYVGRPIAL
jgi:hypothetical protein